MSKEKDIKKDSKGVRIFSNLLAASIVLAIILLFNKYYVLVNVFNDNFRQFLWYLNISFFATFIYHLVLIIYDGKIFKAILGLAKNIIGIWVFYLLYKIYPFDFSSVKFSNIIVKFFIIFILFAMIVGTIVEFVSAFNNKKK